MARPSTEAIYVVRVVSVGAGAQGTLPSERRYSATTVAGLALLHATLALTLLLLFLLHVLLPSPGPEVTTPAESNMAMISASSWAVASACVALGPTVTGTLSWKRWYVEANLRRFLAASVFALAASVASTAITSAAILLTPQPRGDHAVEDATTEDPVAEERLERAAAMVHSLALNAAVASALEVLACLASLKVAWSGIRRKDRDEEGEKKDPERGMAPEGGVVPPLPMLRPAAASAAVAVAPDIVPCESSKEYEERMRRFVADAGVDR